MTLQQLLHTCTWSETRPFLQKIFPDRGRLDDYEAFYYKLLQMTASPNKIALDISSDSEGGFSIGTWSALETAAFDQCLSIDLKWDETLDIILEDLLASCLYYLTYHGFTDQARQERLDRFDKSDWDWEDFNEYERRVRVAKE
jgi:hypothetical protein